MWTEQKTVPKSDAKRILHVLKYFVKHTDSVNDVNYADL